MSNEVFEKLAKLAKPLQEFLVWNYDPHCVIVISEDMVEVMRAEMGIPTSLEGNEDVLN